MNQLPEFEYHTPTKPCPIDMKALLENNKRDTLKPEDNPFIDGDGNIIGEETTEKVQ